MYGRESTGTVCWKFVDPEDVWEMCGISTKKIEFVREVDYVGVWKCVHEFCLECVWGCLLALEYNPVYKHQTFYQHK